MNPTINDVRKFLDDLTSHLIFVYNKKPCGIDPLSSSDFKMWYGDKNITAKNIDEVFSLNFFDDKTFSDIFDKINITEM